MNGRYKYIILILSLIVTLCAPGITAAADMNDYAAYPPFISTSTTPNLLLIFDNSGSMYDLAYIDEGDTASGRESSYCYDNTYVSTTTYTGYFVQDTVYAYDFTDSRFEESSFPGSCTHQISGQLCINIVSGSVTDFYAKGNYLNWLTSSKMDVQKEILTGGKYNMSTDEFLAETRGCMGRRFLKEPLTADYVEGGANTSLGITLAVTGPDNEYNPSGISNGGQTYLQVFEGDYNESLCQDAIEAVVNHNNPASIRSAVEDCLSYDPSPTASQYCYLSPSTSCSVDSDCDTVAEEGGCSSGKKSERTCLSPASMVGETCINDADCDTIASSVGPCVGSTASVANRTQIIFASSMQECWQIWDDKFDSVGHDAWSSDAPKCEDIYDEYKTCTGGGNDGTECSTDAECTDGGTCTNGPDAIKAGNPALVCNSTYAGYCATTTDDWATTTWVSREYDTAEECFRAKYSEFCGDVNVPPVIDPSDAPSSSDEYANVPAIIADVGVEAQLGSPLSEMTVKRHDTTGPTGLLNEFEDMIRFGVMSFNYNGSEYECDLSSTDALECPKVCSVTSDVTCYEDVDCPSGETCVSATSNSDGASILNYIGYGNCSTTTSTSCQEDDDCPSGETCDLIGDHSIGLIKAIDDIEATSWTPFAEAFYNAVAYYVRDSTLYSVSADAAQPLNSTDFAANRNPVQYTCQSNNILIISDGASTADYHPTIVSKGLDSRFNDGTADTAVCGSYTGSTYLDDFSYFARNSNIYDPGDPDTSDNDLSQRITTYSVYTGAQTSTETGECDPKTLMDNTADNGGTVLYNAQDPSQLSSALTNAFQEVASGAASGTAVSVLSTTGEGEGAIYQAYFLPETIEGSEVRKWLGHINAMFVDKYGNLREDTDGDNTLSLTGDRIIEMTYDTATGSTIVNKYLDADGDGARDSTSPSSSGDLDDLNALWEGGELLWQRDPSDRTIFTTIDGYTRIDFTAANVADLAPYLNNSTDTAENTTLINWIRGADTTITDTSHDDGYRARDITIGGTSDIWKLGDIGHSTPTSVSKPVENYDLLYGDITYHNYRKAHINRRLALYTGANDGMLHAFNGGCFDADAHKFYPDVDSSGNCTSGSHTLGEELWAFIPRALLPHLKWSSLPEYTHVYYVDLKPKITDVKIFSADSDHTDGWGTILIGGFRLGGNDISWDHDGTSYSASPEYFALDITDPLNPRLLWTFTEADLGLTMTFPSITKIGNTWYAVFGSGATGFDIDSNLDTFQDGTLYVLDLNSGSNGVINSWTLNSNYWKISTGNSNTFLADPINVDVDLDFDTDALYFGENYKGGGIWNSRMHRITTNKGALSPGAWILSTLGNVSDISDGKDKSMKITAAPSAATDDRGNLFVYFGTGQFLGSDDKNQTDTGAFYAIKDECWNGSCSTEYSDLLDISLASVSTDGTVSGISGACAGSVSTWPDILTASYSCDGWAMYFDSLLESTDFTGAALSHDGERVLAKPLIIGGLALWTTYIPGVDVCSNEGESNIYAVYYATGTGYEDYVFKEQEDQASPSTTVGRVKKLGAGMPSSISAQITAAGTAKGFVQQSTGSILEIENLTPISIESDVTGWKNEEIE